MKARTKVDSKGVAKGRLAIGSGKDGKRALASYRLKKKKKALPAGRKTKLKPKLSKKAYKAAARALRDRGKVTAKIRVKATVPGAEPDKAKRKIRLLRP